jgi:uncharacterized Zn-finger protein
MPVFGLGNQPWEQETQYRNVQDDSWTTNPTFGRRNDNVPIAAGRPFFPYQDLDVPFQPGVQDPALHWFYPDASSVTETLSPETTVSGGPSALFINRATRRRAHNCRIVCLPCHQSFTRPSDLTRHNETKHTPPKPCAFCGRLMAVRRDKYKEHLEKGHKMSPEVAREHSLGW